MQKTSKENAENNNSKDIFDKIMELPLLNILEPFYKKNKEMLLYLFFGGLSFVISVVTFAIFCNCFNMNTLIANVLSWIITVLFAFLTNRIWVFNSSTNGWKEFAKQIFSFYCGRIITLLIEEIILFIFISKLNLNNILIKIIAQIVVIIGNYIISKKMVFR